MGHVIYLDERDEHDRLRPAAVSQPTVLLRRLAARSRTSPPSASSARWARSTGSRWTEPRCAPRPRRGGARRRHALRRGVARAANPRRLVRAGTAAAARLARPLPRDAARCALRAATFACEIGAGAAVRARGEPARVLRRLRPRGSRDAGRGRGRRRRPAGRMPERRPARRGAMRNCEANADAAARARRQRAARDLYRGPAGCKARPDCWRRGRWSPGAVHGRPAARARIGHTPRPGQPGTGLQQ